MLNVGNHEIILIWDCVDLCLGCLSWTKKPSITSFFSQLKQRAVAYVNVADCVSGDVLEAEASFSLKSVVDRAMKNIPDPTETEYSSSRSYFDYFNNGGGMGGGWGQSWSGSTRQKFSHISDIQSEGDLHPFAFVAGVPSINLRFVKEQNNPTKVNLPLSNTQYDDMDHYWRIDPSATLLLRLGLDITSVLCHFLFYFRIHLLANLQSPSCRNCQTTCRFYFTTSLFRRVNHGQND